MEHSPLEPDFLKAVDIAAPSFSGASPSFASAIALITVILLMLVGGAAFYTYLMAGIHRLEASENGVRKSNEAIRNATYGLLGVFLMFLIFGTFNRDLLVGDVGLGAFRSQGGTSGGSILNLPQNIPPIDPSTPAPQSGSIQERIFSAATSYRGTSTRNVPQTEGGRKACAYAVNEVLKMAGVAPMGGLSVVNMEAELRKGRGAHIPTSKAVPGDLVIVTGAGNHVGICLSAGCTEVISNSSSNASFSWISGPNFTPSYRGLQGRVYRVTN
jgi:hypothetical protein